MRLKKTLLPILLVYFISHASTFSGEWGNFLYFRHDRIDTTRYPVNYYEGLTLQVRKIAGTDISAFANVNATNGFAGVSRKNIEVVHTYVDWTDIAKCIDLRVGRQRSFEMNEPVYFDGLKIHGRIGSNFTVTAYGGARVPSRFLSRYVQTKIDSNAFDLALRGQGRFGATQAGLTFSQALSGKKSVEQLGSADVSYFFKDAYAGGFLIYNITSQSIDEFQVTGSARLFNNLDAFGSISRFNRIKVDSSNVFLTRVFRDYYEADVSLSYKLPLSLQATGGYVARSIDKSEPAHEVFCGIGHGRFDVRFTQKWGYGGTETRADAGVGLLKIWILDSRLDGGFLRYTRADSGAASQIAWLGDFSVSAKPAARWGSFRLGVQGMGNTFYTYDIRVYLQSQVWFSTFTK